MLKTIKTTKYLNLHELIKYVWENDVTDKDFKSETSPHVIVTATQLNNVINNGFAIEKNDLFTVEIEEEITEDTELDCVISVDSDGYTSKTFNTTIDYLNSIYSDLVQILANIDGKYRTIWERDDHGSN